MDLGTVVAGALVAASAAFLAVRVWRTWRGGAACGGCGACGRPTAPRGTPLLPLERGRPRRREIPR